MVRVVLDTNVLYSAILKSTGNEARVFDLAVESQILPCVSPAVLAEYRSVLFRPALKQHRKRTAEVLELFTEVAVHVIPPLPLRISCHESDNRIYECADAAKADYIVTGNTRHFKSGYGHTKIVSARQLLSLIMPVEPGD